MRIGYLGPSGTFSHEAALKYMNGGAHETAEFSTIPLLVQAAEEGQVDLAVLPIENSVEGGVNATLDCLASSKSLTIAAEFILRVRQNLLSNAKEITTIYSHPQPVGQCAGFLARDYPLTAVVFTRSTAEAAIIAAKEEGAAAIGSDALAGMYGLSIVAKGIEDTDTNATRFVVAGRNVPVPERANKTSLVFGLSNKPGELYKLLSVFSIFDINLVKIESRPAKTALGAYIFFVDINGTALDADIRRALEILEYKSNFFKLLGSYEECEIEAAT